MEPKLTAAQFDENGMAQITCRFAGRTIKVCYHNPLLLDWGEYRIESVHGCEALVEENGAWCVIPRAALPDDTRAINVNLSMPESGGRHV